MAGLVFPLLELGGEIATQTVVQLGVMGASEAVVSLAHRHQRQADQAQFDHEQAMSLAAQNASNAGPGAIPAPATSASGSGPGSAAPPAAHAGHKSHGKGHGGNPNHDPKDGEFTSAR